MGSSAYGRLGRRRRPARHAVLGPESNRERVAIWNVEECCGIASCSRSTGWALKGEEEGEVEVEVDG